MKSHWRAADLIGFGQLQQLQGPGPMFGAAQQRSACAKDAIEGKIYRKTMVLTRGFMGISGI